MAMARHTPPADLAAAAALDARGFVPAPGEPLDQLRQRAAAQTALSTTPEHTLAQCSGLAFAKHERIPPLHLAAARRDLAKRIAADPDWLIGWYSARSLPPGAGAVTWSTKHGVALQLHPGLRKCARVWSLDRQELLLHEGIHAVRTPLRSTRYEELFAHWYTRHAARRVLTPLLRSAGDAVAFALAAAVSVLGDATVALPRWLWLLAKSPVLAVALSATLRLAKHARIRRRLPAYLTAQGVLPQHVFAVAARLTDAEVDTLSSSSAPACLRTYAATQHATSLRWRVLHARFL